MTHDDYTRLRALDTAAREAFAAWRATVDPDTGAGDDHLAHAASRALHARNAAAGEALGALLDALAAAEAEAEHLRPYALLTMARSGRLVVPEPIPDDCTCGGAVRLLGRRWTCATCGATYGPRMEEP